MNVILIFKRGYVYFFMHSEKVNVIFLVLFNSLNLINNF